MNREVRSFRSGSMQTDQCYCIDDKPFSFEVEDNGFWNTQQGGLKDYCYNASPAASITKANFERCFLALPTMFQLSTGMTQTVMNQNFTATSAAQAETDNQKISHKTRMKAEVQDSHNGREIIGDFVVSNSVLRRSFIQSYLQEEIQRILAAIAGSVIVHHDSNSEEESAEMKCLISCVSCLRGGRLLLNKGAFEDTDEVHAFFRSCNVDFRDLVVNEGELKEAKKKTLATEVMEALGKQDTKVLQIDNSMQYLQKLNYFPSAPIFVYTG
nr:hypothetical protein Iba_chr07fCG11340 [Ipomoea batatas]